MSDNLSGSAAVTPASGNTPEGFLKSAQPSTTNQNSQKSTSSQNLPKVPPRPQSKVPPAVPPASWYMTNEKLTNKPEQKKEDEKCDNSLYTQFKDLFVK